MTTTSIRLTFRDLDLDVAIDYEAATPAILRARAEDCEPGTPAYLDIDKVYLVLPPPAGSHLRGLRDITSLFAGYTLMDALYNAVESYLEDLEPEIEGPEFSNDD